MMTIIFFFLLFNLQKFIHELGHFILAKRAGIAVEEFGFGYRPRVAKLWKRKGTLYTLNWLPFGCFIKMSGEKDASIPGGFASKSKKIRFTVLVIGPILNLITLVIFLTPAIFFFTLANLAGVPEPVTGINVTGEEASVAKTVISEVVPGTPAAEAGLQIGDIIVGADDTEFKHVGDVVGYIEKTKGTEITLYVEREGQQVDVPIVPRLNPPENQGALGIGITYEDIESKITVYPLPAAFINGVTTTAQYIELTFYIPIAVSRDSIPVEAVQPAGSDEFERQMVSAVVEGVAYNRWFQTFWFMGVLSLSVTLLIEVTTVISLLPLPGWDSWRILSLIIK